MRFSLICVLAAVAVNAGVLSGSKEPDLQVSINFSSKNTGRKVFNGHSENLLLVRAVNLAGEQLVISAIRSSYFTLDTAALLSSEKLLKNSTTLPLRQVVLPGLATPVIRYKFHSEQKPGKVGLKVYVDYFDAGNRPHTRLGFDGPVNIIEPKKKAFDLQVLSLYFMLAGALLASSIYFYGPYARSFDEPTVEPLVPSSITEIKSSKSKAKATITEPKVVDPATEWIPEALLRTRKGKKNQGNGGK